MTGLSRWGLPIALALATLSACDADKREPKPPSVQEMLARRALADTRTDSFSLAADRGRVLGDSTAPVWIVAVMDYQCADCKRWHDDVLPRIMTDYVATGRVRVAFLNMPQAQHLNGMPSALASVCAAAEGKFRETSASIFATQARWKDLPNARPFLDSLALAAGVDSAAHHRCSDQFRGQKAVRTDMERAAAAGVSIVPTFFVGTHKVVGYSTSAAFRAVVDSAVAGK